MLENLILGIVPAYLTIGFGCFDAGYWMLDAGYWMLDTGYWILDAGYWMLANTPFPHLILKNSRL